MFENKESYKHKCAKDILRDWFQKHGSEGIGDIHARSNRKCELFLEYPICKTKNFNSWESNWDEIICNLGETDTWNEYVPTHKECVEKYKTYPVAIIDAILPHKGSPYYAIEICHKNPVSEEKIKKLRDFGVSNLIEIEADWILNQIDIPKKLKYKQLI